MGDFHGGGGGSLDDKKGVKERKISMHIPLCIISPFYQEVGFKDYKKRAWQKDNMSLALSPLCLVY